VDEHQQKEGPERPGKSAPEDGQSADKVAKGEEFLGGEISICELVAEEHPDDRRDWEGIEDQGGLPRGKADPWQIIENQGKPSPPDEELQDHHQK
jgi:hypothetical protein